MNFASRFKGDQQSYLWAMLLLPRLFGPRSAYVSFALRGPKHVIYYKLFLLLCTSVCISHSLSLLRRVDRLGLIRRIHYAASNVIMDKYAGTRQMTTMNIYCFLPALLALAVYLDERLIGYFLLFRDVHCLCKLLMPLVETRSGHHVPLPSCMIVMPSISQGA